MSDKDLAILNRVLLYTAIPLDQRRQVLAGASEEVRRMGEALLNGTAPEDFPSAHATVKQWRENRRMPRIARDTTRSGRLR